MARHAAGSERSVGAVNSGGTLLLNGSGGQDMIGNTTGVTLAGGKLQLGTTPTSINGSMGAQRLISSSVIDFGALTGTLTFSDAIFTGGANLDNWNWSGQPLLGGGTDRLFFTTG